MVNTWLTSDLHLSHAKLAELRGFDSIEEHNKTIKDNYFKLVKPDDHVYFLGDLTSGGSKTIAPMLEELATWPGKKRLAPGNHDPISPIHRTSEKWEPLYREVFESVQHFYKKKYSGKYFLLMHFPRTQDHTSDVRYKEFRMTEWDGWRIHGHTHSNIKRQGNEICVCLEAWDLNPVSISQIIELVEDTDE